MGLNIQAMNHQHRNGVDSVGLAEVTYKVSVGREESRNELLEEEEEEPAKGKSPVRCEVLKAKQREFQEGRRDQPWSAKMRTEERPLGLATRRVGHW